MHPILHFFSWVFAATLFCFSSTIQATTADKSADMQADNGTWHPVAGIDHHRRFTDVVKMKDSNDLFVAGGVNFIEPIKTALRYDWVSNTWKEVAPMHTVRAKHTTTVLNDGRILVTGGVFNLPSFDGMADAEIYDPHANAWVRVVEMSIPRHLHTATLLTDGRVLITGGSGESGATPLAEIYDPQRNRWQSIAPMSSPRANHTATRLGNGQVLIVGGYAERIPPPFLNTAELFNLVTQTWEPTAPMRSSRTYHLAIPIGNEIYMVSGDVYPDPASGEKFIPAP